MGAYRKFVISAIFVTIVIFLQLFVVRHWGVVTEKHVVDFNANRKNVSQKLFNKSEVSTRPIEVKISKFKNGSLMLYSALVTNSSKNATWDIIVAQGWIEEKKKLSFVCCVIHNSGDIVNYKGTSKQTWYLFDYPSVKYGAIQFQCHTGGNLGKFGVPSKVAIYSKSDVVGQTCAKNLNHFVDIDFAYKQSGITIFLKVLFGQLSYLDLLAWFEIHRSLGVNKVLGYVTDDLNEKARVVLGHYQRMGLFEALHYPSPFVDTEYRSQSKQKFNYNGVSMFDGQVRLRGYDYLISIDADEYLIPTHLNESLREVFDRLFSKQNTRGFSFEMYTFVKNWGGEGNSPFSVGKYFTRTNETHDRVKHVVVPSRINIGTLLTHGIVNYKRHYAKTDDIALRHYRMFRSKPPNNATNFDKLPRIKDLKVYKIFKSLEGNIGRIRNVRRLDKKQ